MVEIPVILYLIRGAADLKTNDLPAIIDDTNRILAPASVKLVPVGRVFLMDIDD